MKKVPEQFGNSINRKLWENPYISDGYWYKGNLHTHSKNSKCGFYSIEDILREYENPELRYDFLSITDHDYYSDINPYREKTGLLLIPGVEESRLAHIVAVNSTNVIMKDNQTIIDLLNKNNGLAILAHPHWSKYDYWSEESALVLQGYTGIEIINVNVCYEPGSYSLATDLWDKLLSRGRRIWGFGSDDLHKWVHIGQAWINVRARSKTVTDIINSIKAGNFYVSTGVNINSIDIIDDSIHIDYEDNNERSLVRYIGKDGRILFQQEGYCSSSVYKLPKSEAYVRAQITLESGKSAWTQPVFCNYYAF